MSLFALLPFWVLTQFSKAICPRHSLAHLTYSLTYSFLDTVKDFVLKTFFHNLFHCLRECFVNQLVALHVRIFCKPISRFFWVTAIKHKKFGALIFLLYWWWVRREWCICIIFCLNFLNSMMIQVTTVGFLEIVPFRIKCHNSHIFASLVGESTYLCVVYWLF